MRITKAWSENGIPISPEKIYTIDTNSYQLSTASALPAGSGNTPDIGAAGSLIRFPKKKKEIHDSDISRAEATLP